MEVEFIRKKLLILYGTSTGTAREVALRIAREAHSFGRSDPDGMLNFFAPEVLSMKDTTVEYLAECSSKETPILMFVVSTTGQGEFPEEAKHLWKELRKTSAPDVPVQYAVIGLGDSSYELYNYPAKKLHRRLQQLKGISSFNVCLCDDQHDLGYVGALNPFLEQCWHAWVPPDCRSARRDEMPVPRFRFSDLICDAPQSSSVSRINIQKVPVIRNERVTAIDHHQDTRLIAFDTSESSLRFEEGDALQVYSENFPEHVELFFELFPKLRNQPPFYVHCIPETPWEKIPDALYDVCGPQPWTWEQIAKKLLDLQSIPGTYVFEVLRRYTSDPLIREKFDEYCLPEGLEELYNYINRPRRIILEVLQDFSGELSNVPHEYIFDLIPFMRPRAFSIASPPKETHHIEILVAVVEYRTNLKKSRKGTCSYWLAHHCNLGQKVAIYCEKGSLTPPKSDCHMIMVGPGTGVAPFRSMIKQYPNKWDKHLFFGCRGKDKDYYFGSEFEEMVEAGNLMLYNAFSRDSSGRKVDYVQDVILRQEELFKTMLGSPLPLYIYVCGRSGDMPKDVYNAFKNILQRLGVENPEKFLKHMLLTGQYQAETY